MRHSDFIHPTAIVSDDCVISPGTKVLVYAQIRERSQIGRDCILSKDVYVDRNVSIGAPKIQNGVSIYDGVRIEENVFIGPHACFTNDKVPALSVIREITPTLVKRVPVLEQTQLLFVELRLGNFWLARVAS